MRNRIVIIALVIGATFWPLQSGFTDDTIDARLAKVIADLEHPDPQVALEAFAAIRHRYGPRAEPAIPTLIELLKSDPMETDHTQVCKALAAIGRAAVTEVVKLLSEDNDGWRGLALWTLRMSGAKAPDLAVPALITALDDQEPSIRYGALRALAAIGSRSKETKAAVPAMVRALKDKDAGVRSRAATALASMGPAAEPAVPLLIAQLEDNDNTARAIAIHTLSAIGPNARAATSKLIPILKDEILHEDAAFALGRIGLNGEDDVARLIGILRCELPRSRQLAASLLARAGSDASPAVQPLIASLDDATTREFAINALGRIGQDAKPAVPQLIKLLTTDDTYFIRAGAAEALGRIGAPARAAIPALETAAADTNALIRQHAKRALRMIMSQK